MRKFAVLILVLHALVESLMGLLMILAAHKVSTTAGPSEQGIMITYGFAALTMALVVAWFWPHRSNVAAVGIAWASWRHSIRGSCSPRQ